MKEQGEHTMARSFRRILRDGARKNALPSNRPDATVNRAGGVSFEIADPATKLITMTGGAFFGEPRFYSGSDCVPVRSFGGAFAPLQARLEIARDKSVSFARCEELDDTAQEIIATILAVLDGDTPEDALVIAAWLRNDANIRLTPQVILTLAANHENGKPFVRKYAPKIMLRPDEAKTNLLLHRFFFGSRNLPNSLNKAIGDGVARFGEWGLIKYDTPSFPRWKDVLRWIKRRNGWPLSRGLARYFTHGEVDRDATPIAYARSLLAQKTTLDTETRELITASRAT